MGTMRFPACWNVTGPGAASVLSAAATDASGHTLPPEGVISLWANDLAKQLAAAI